MKRVCFLATKKQTAPQSKAKGRERVSDSADEQSATSSVVCLEKTGKTTKTQRAQNYKDNARFTVSSSTHPPQLSRGFHSSLNHSPFRLLTIVATLFFHHHKCFQLRQRDASQRLLADRYSLVTYKPVCTQPLVTTSTRSKVPMRWPILLYADYTSPSPPSHPGLRGRHRLVSDVDDVACRSHGRHSHGTHCRHVAAAACFPCTATMLC